MHRPKRSPRTSEDLLAEMIHHLGWQAAHALVDREAELLRCSPASPLAIGSAYIVYQATRPKPAQQGRTTHHQLKETPMSALVRLSSKLPGDEEINGLDAIAEDLQEETTVVALVWISPREVRRVIATGDEVPVVEIRRIEPLGTPDVIPPEVVKLVLDQQAQRTGRTPLPIDQVVAPKGDVDELDDGPPPSNIERPKTEPTPIREGLVDIFDSGAAK